MNCFWNLEAEGVDKASVSWSGPGRSWRSRLLSWLLSPRTSLGSEKLKDSLRLLRWPAAAPQDWFFFPHLFLSKKECSLCPINFELNKLILRLR